MSNDCDPAPIRTIADLRKFTRPIVKTVLEMHGPRDAQPEQADGSAATDKPGPTMTDEAKALALLIDHPEWSNKQIAKAVGCNVRTLYKWKKFQEAKDILKAGRTERPRGRKDADGNLHV